MANIRTSVAISTIRGSIGGTTFAQNSAGPYVRNRSIPTNRNTQRQIIVRSTLSYLVDFWRDSLTATQRQAWNDVAAQTQLKNKLGEMYVPTGRSLFVRQNASMNPEGIGQQAIDTLPPVTILGSQPLVTATISHTTGLSITAVDAAGAETWMLYIYATKVLGGQIDSVNQAYSYVDSIDDGTELPYVNAALAGGAAGDCRYLRYVIAALRDGSTSYSVSTGIIYRVTIT